MEFSRLVIRITGQLFQREAEPKQGLRSHKFLLYLGKSGIMRPLQLK